MLLLYVGGGGGDGSTVVIEKTEMISDGINLYDDRTKTM